MRWRSQDRNEIDKQRWRVLMVDYGKLIVEERARKDSAVAIAEARQAREIEVVALFRNVEIDLGEETAKANEELKEHGSPTIDGPFRPVKDEEKIDLTFGLRKPACRLTLQNTDPLVGLSRIHVELFDETTKQIAQTDFVIECEATNLKAYKALVEGFPDRAAEVNSADMAREIVPGIIRGRFV
jgi:hypothetical protein